MSDIPENPMGREYTRAEKAAGVRVGAARYDGLQLSGQMVYATGSYWPECARKMADDWKLVADAMEREWGDAQ